MTTGSRSSSIVLIDWYLRDSDDASSLSDDQLKSEADHSKDSLSIRSFYGSLGQKKLHAKRSFPPEVVLGKPSKKVISKRSRSQSSLHSTERKAKRPARRVSESFNTPRYSRLDVKLMHDGKEVEDDDVENRHTDSPGVSILKNSAKPKWMMLPARGKNFDIKFKLSHDVVSKKMNKRSKLISTKLETPRVWPQLDVLVVKNPSPLRESSRLNTFSGNNMNQYLVKKNTAVECEVVCENERNSEGQKTKSEEHSCKRNAVTQEVHEDALEPSSAFNTKSVFLDNKEQKNSVDCNTEAIILLDKDSENIPVPSSNAAENDSALSDTSSKENRSDDAKEATPKRFYPIFDSVASQKLSNKNSTPLQQKNKRTSPKSLNWKSLCSKDGLHQMIIDAGQREIGPKQCQVCHMLYTIGDPEDEILHARYHSHIAEGLSFPGWKKENVLGIYADGRIIGVRPSDPKFMLKKVESVLTLTDSDLGISNSCLPTKPGSLFLLFILTNKRIAGCLIAEPISEAYHITLPSTLEMGNLSVEESSFHDSTPVKALCGVNRIWTHREHRRKKIATRLLDTVRYHFAPGIVLSFQDMAFSDPTLCGRQLAQKYTGLKTFLVYKY